MTEPHVEYEVDGMPRRTFTVPLREEYAMLTGDMLAALVLQQMIYWSQRARDVDAYIIEERQRDPDVKIALTHGWIYKSMDDLAAELFNTQSPKTVGRRLDMLVERGWLIRRQNPNHKWDHTYQYRVDLLKVSEDLADIGYALPDHTLRQTVHSKRQVVSLEPQTVSTIPETTTETTTDTTGRPAANAAPQTADDRRDSEVGEGVVEETVKNIAVETASPRRKKRESEGGEGSAQDTLPGIEVETESPQKGNGQAYFLALANACRIDLKLATKRQRYQIGQSSSILREAGATPEEIDGFGEWWANHYWKGRDGQAPRPAQVREDWGQYKAFAESGGDAKRGDWRERITIMG